MQAEKAVEIDDGIAGNIDSGAHGVIGLLAIRDNDVQAIGGATLENNNQAFVLAAQRLRAEGGTSEKGRQRRSPHDSQGAVAHKHAAGNRHKVSLLCRPKTGLCRHLAIASLTREGIMHLF